MTLAKCEVCGREVAANQEKEYVYLLLCVGKPGHERPLFSIKIAS